MIFGGGVLKWARDVNLQRLSAKSEKFRKVGLIFHVSLVKQNRKMRSGAWTRVHTSAILKCPRFGMPV